MNLRIRDLREDADLTQRQMADYLFCTTLTYSRYERREREIPLEIICKLADYYNTTLDYLVGRTADR